MPFHIPGSQMNAFPPPFLFSSLSPPILPFFYPHLHTVPASFPQLLSRAGHNIGGGMRTGGWGGRGGKEEDMCVWMWWEEETVADIPTQGICLQVCVHLRGNVWLLPCICALVRLCEMPMGQFLATHHAVVATVLWQQRFDICEGWIYSARNEAISFP